MERFTSPSPPRPSVFHFASPDPEARGRLEADRLLDEVAPYPRDRRLVVYVHRRSTPGGVTRELASMLDAGLLPLASHLYERFPNSANPTLPAPGVSAPDWKSYMFSVMAVSVANLSRIAEACKLSTSASSPPVRGHMFRPAGVHRTAVADLLSEAPFGPSDDSHTRLHRILASSFDFSFPARVLSPYDAFALYCPHTPLPELASVVAWDSAPRPQRFRLRHLDLSASPYDSEHKRLTRSLAAVSRSPAELSAAVAAVSGAFSAGQQDSELGYSRPASTGGVV